MRAQPGVYKNQDSIEIYLLMIPTGIDEASVE